MNNKKRQMKLKRKVSLENKINFFDLANYFIEEDKKIIVLKLCYYLYLIRCYILAFETPLEKQSFLLTENKYWIEQIIPISLYPILKKMKLKHNSCLTKGFFQGDSYRVRQYIYLKEICDEIILNNVKIDVLKFVNNYCLETTTSRLKNVLNFAKKQKK
ncbi:MAG: hypothetical protein Q8874_01155 [Sweet potato little leaf phytoplasma]|nr:hypothetical protein [Sweet potato little leaf phytoplasma]